MPKDLDAVAATFRTPETQKWSRDACRCTRRALLRHLTQQYQNWVHKAVLSPGSSLGLPVATHETSGWYLLRGRLKRVPGTLTQPFEATANRGTKLKHSGDG